ncbi:hypothetical protein KY332_00185 [Candidatus Woesearchaeota archaeon]|nr:hypothetical protein [Candidatus Woesearchaeota archaeon]
MDKKGNPLVKIIIVIVIIIVVWGIIGGFAARDPGVTCDIGLGDVLCWKWHKNIVGQAGEFLKNVFG